MKRYPGTLPFTTADKDLFFGRQKEMAELYQLISLEQLVVLYGKSGLGKSSLIQAGIIPQVLEANEYLPINIRFTAFHGKDSETPTEITRTAIADKFTSKTFLRQLKKEDKTLWTTAKNRQINGGGKQLVLFFDQFEELFQYPNRSIQIFLRELRELLNTSVPQRFRDELNQQKDDFLTEDEEDILYENLDIKVVFSIRSDRMHLMNKLSKNLPKILSNNYELLPLALEDAKAAIVLPAQKEGKFDSKPFTYQEAALEKVLNFLKDDETQRVEAFQLQLLCQTFEQKVERVGYREIDISVVGDLEKVVDEYFQNSLATLSEEQQTAVNLLIAKDLVSPDGKARYSIFEEKLKATYNIDEDLLTQLENLRLLRREKTSRGVIYEISHDTFLKSAGMIQANLELEEQKIALAKAEAEAKAAKEREEMQRNLYLTAEKEKAEAEKQRQLAEVSQIEAEKQRQEAEKLKGLAESKTVIAEQSEKKASKNFKTALFLLILASIIAIAAYFAWLESEKAKQEIIVNQAVSKAKELQNYGKSYAIYGKADFACDSYRKAFATLDSIDATKDLNIYKALQKQIKKCD